MNQSNSCRNRKNSSDQAGASPRFLTAILLFLLFPLLVIANPPSWWTEQQVVNSNASPNDYAAINQGQLKHLSKQAYLHMQAKLPPSIWTSAAATNLTAFIQGFQTNSPYNYSAVNLGQLKNTAKKFYDVLNAAGYTNTAFATPYPWTGHEAQVNNYAMANIGQAKNLFSFDLSQFLPQSVKQQIVDADLNDGITSVNQVLPGDDFDNDGVANLSEYQQGGDPTNYYSQGSQTIVPVLTIVSGNDQTSLPSEFLSSPLIIKMENGTGAALANAPVSFSVTAGNGGLALTNVGAPQTSSSLIVRTGLDGQAQVYYQQPSVIGTESHVMAQAGTAIPVQFTLKTAIPAPTGVRLWYYYSHVALFWNSSTAIPIDSYEIQQSVDGSTWTSLGIVDGNTHFFVLPSLTSGVNNLFKVIAKSGAINSEPAIASVSAGPSLRPETINVTLRAGEGYDRLLSVLNNQLNSSNLTITASGAGVSEKGYSWEDSDMSGGPAYVWNDISTTGTKLNVISETDDDYESFSTLFSFPFYSNSYTQIYVSSNGYITLGTGSSNYQNSSLPDANAPANIIAPLWDDLRTSTDGDIYYLNEADKTTIQFENVATNNGSGNYTFQIVLHKNGEIDFYYKSLTGALDSSTVGLQNSDGSIGALVSYNQNYLKNNFAVRFTKSWLYLFTSGSQEIQAGGMQTLNVWFSALGLEAGTHTASIAVTSGNETLTLPVTLNVVASGQSDLDDSDNDQLLDWWELKYWGDLSQNGTGDFDGDGILNATEYANGTNPLWGNPSITITSPINEGQYELHSSIPVSASISYIPAVSAVYFYLNGSLQIGMKTVLPYQTTVENIGFGDYTISAVVYTLTGESYSSNVVTIHVPNPYDTNGLPLAWEMQYFGHTGVSATGDADNDGVSNWDEYINGSNPTIADTDGDGFSDSDENSAGSNSNNSSDTPDNSTQLTVRVGISDQDFNDDIWSLSVETSDEDGNFTGSKSDVVDNQGNPHGTSYGTTHIDYGKSVKFTMGRIEAGQYRGTDEYTASFEPQGSEEKKKRWLSESDNSSLSNSLPWTGDGSTPPDPSSLKWVFTAVLADLSILKQDGTEIPEAQEESQGWIVFPRKSDGTLVTKLKLHKVVPSRISGKYTLRIEGSRINLWKDASGTQAIDASTEIDATVDTTIYAESNSGSETGVQKIYLSWKNDAKGQSISDIDKVSLYPVGIDRIAFNYKPSSSSDDALSIRKDYSTTISVPEYVKDVQNEAAAYIRNKSIGILVRITSECPAITTMKIKGVSDDSGVLGDTEEKTVTFVGGFSKEGVDDPTTLGMDESEFAKFKINTNTPNQIQKSVEAWKWYITEINGTTVSDIFYEKTSGHIIYIIWDEPKLPWNQESNNVKNPWVKALDFAIDTASSKSKDDVGALTSITSYLHTGHGLTYDINGGSPAYASSNLGGTMNLSSYIEKKSGTAINCYDQASGVFSLGRLLGIDVKYRYMDPFGYINTLNLVGEGPCNNPFYPISSSHSKISGGDDVEPIRLPFGNHAFALYGGKVYDATAGPQTGTRTEAQYLTDAIDTSTTNEAAVAGSTANIVDGNVSDVK